MTWLTTPPRHPGRYWWRAASPYPKRPDMCAYGLLLISWRKLAADFEPELRITHVTAFNSVFGGELNVDGGGWSSSGGWSLDDPCTQYPGITYWSEPVLGPENFLPVLPGRPDWTPPDPAVEAAKRKKDDAAQAKREKEEAAATAKLIADAIAAGKRLFVCQQCDDIVAEADLIEVRECPHCGDEKFDGTSNGRNCPTCNRPFSRQVTVQGHDECLEECEPMSETPGTPVVSVAVKKIPKTRRKRR